MTLGQFAVACGAEPKWIQNAAHILGWRLRYAADEARQLGLVKRLHADLGVSLEVASRLAASALARWDEGAAEALSVPAGGLIRMTIDVRRYLSDFAVRLARARVQCQPRRRGRPATRWRSAIVRARRHGIDIGLVRAALLRSPADRIRRLNDNMEFTRTLRGRLA